MGPKLPWKKQGVNPFFQFLVAEGILQLVATSLQPLPPQSHHVLLCMCVKSLSAFLLPFFYFVWGGGVWVLGGLCFVLFAF